MLWVKAGKLLPLDTGGKIRSYNILRRLTEEHSVTLLSYYGGPHDPAYDAALLGHFPGSHVFCTRTPESHGIRGLLDYLFRLPRPAPYSVSKFTHRKVRRAVTRFLSSQAFDVAVCDFLAASLNFAVPLPIHCVLFQHNVESSLWRRMAAIETNPVKKPFYVIESMKMSRYERRTLSRFHHIIAVSEHDRQQMLEMEPECGITVVPTGVDTRYFQAAPPSSATPPRIVFIGSMDWEPNIDAAVYFCTRIWPRIQADFPDATFQIVGRNPFPEVQRLASTSIQVTGSVPSVTEYLRDATVVVVPLRIGGGTRLKIFEAMAVGKAVVSTSIGAEGLRVQNGRDLLLADGAVSFANAIALLLRDAVLRRRLEQAALQLAAQYDWSVVIAHFVDALRRVGASNKSVSNSANRAFGS